MASRARVALTCLALACAAAAVHLPRLGSPPVLVYDEEFAVPPARAYVAGLPLHDNLTHPPLDKLMIAGSIFCFGDSPASWRLPSAIAGMLLPPVLYLLGREALASDRAALVAAVLFLFDGVLLLLSRLAMNNVPGLLFELTALFLVLRAARSDELKAGPLLGAAAAFGLALATRWTAVPVAALAGVALVDRQRGRLLRARELGLLALAAALAAGLLVLCYVPWLAAAGHSIWELPRIQRAMVAYHRSQFALHPYASRWYAWPWLYRPPLFLYQRVGASGEWVQILFAIGNPAVWWAALPSVAAALVAGLRRFDRRPLFCVLGFAASYTLWVFTRPLQFAHYFLSSIPFVCLSLGWHLDRAWDGKLRALCFAYLGVAALLFVHFYPLQTALPIPSGWFFHRLFDGVYPWRWFSSWYEQAPPS